MIAPVGLRVGRGLLFTSKRSLVDRIDIPKGKGNVCGMEFLAKANFFELIGYFVLSCVVTAAVLAYGHKIPYEVIIFVGFTSAILGWLQGC
jgi:hypothetical protein